MSQDTPEGGNPKPVLSRRLLVTRGAAVAGVGVMLPGVAGAQSGITDSDPNDGPGRGRGGNRPRASDNDPRDAAGRGRGSSRGTTDNDPRDGAGAGRGSGNRGTGLTDSDPSDGPGRGRGR